MPDSPRQISNAVLGERIDQQGKTLNEISCDLKMVNGTLSSFMTTYGVEHQKVAGSTTAAHQRIDELRLRVETIEKGQNEIKDNVQSIMTRMGWLMWLASGLGLLTLGLIFKLITGEATVVFP